MQSKVTVKSASWRAFAQAPSNDRRAVGFFYAKCRHRRRHDRSGRLASSSTRCSFLMRMALLAVVAVWAPSDRTVTHHLSENISESDVPLSVRLGLHHPNRGETPRCAICSLVCSSDNGNMATSCRSHWQLAYHLSIQASLPFSLSRPRSYIFAK